MGAGHGAGIGIDIARLMEQLSQQTGEGGGTSVDVTQVPQQLSSQVPPGGGVDMSNLLQVMGPMMHAMQAQRSARPCATAEGAVATVPAGRSSHKRNAQQKKRHLRPREWIGSSQVGAAHLRGHPPSSRRYRRSLLKPCS